MKIIIVTKTKPSADSGVGITFGVADGRIVLSDVNKSGLFGSTELRPGQQVLSINGTCVCGMSPSEVNAIVAFIEKDVTIQTVSGRQNSLLNYSIVRKGPKETLTFDSHQKQDVPVFLKSMNVSSRKWNCLVESFTTELMPAVQQALNMERILNSEMSLYTRKQMGKGYIGFGQESRHERKVFLMTHQASILHSNLSMVASNVVGKANALLNAHGVMAELAFTVRELPRFSTKQKGRNTINIPMAIKFTPLDDELLGGKRTAAF